MTIEQVRNDLEKVYEQVKNAVGWTVDKRIMMSIASYYATAGKEFRGEKFLAVLDEIKKQARWTSPIRTNIQYMMAAFLADSDHEPSKAVELLLAKEQLLKQEKFRRCTYTYLAALFLPDHLEQAEQDASRAKQLYDEIRKHHRFLTSYEDIPYSVLLGQLEGDLAERATTMNRYYRELREQGLPMGNELQWMSQIMTMQSEVYHPDLVSRVVRMRDQLKEAGVKIKRTYYVSLGFLAVINIKDNELQHLVETYQSLADMKLFKWYKEMVFPIAVLLEAKQSEVMQQQAAIGFSTSIEMILQAQQAAMIAAMAAASASAAASSSSS